MRINGCLICVKQILLNNKSSHAILSTETDIQLLVLLIVLTKPKDDHNVILLRLKLLLPT